MVNLCPFGALNEYLWLDLKLSQFARAGACKSKDSGITISAFSTLLCVPVTPLHQIHKEPETFDIEMFDYDLHVYTELLHTHSPTDSVFSSQPFIIRFSPLIREYYIPWLCRF